MVCKTEKDILEILSKYEELDTPTLANKIPVSYDTVAKHLKRMTDEGTLTREGFGNPWTYHYQIKKEDIK